MYYSTVYRRLPCCTIPLQPVTISIRAKQNQRDLIDQAAERLGSALLRDAILRAFQASCIAGVAALLVHALSEPARQFYLSRGFLESPVQPMTLCLMLATAEKLLETLPDIVRKV